MNKKLVSIILPVFNGEKYLSYAIDSVLKQTYLYFEFIVINDGSTDNTSTILTIYKEKYPRIQVITHNTNIGIVKSLNEGLKLAKGEFIARIDSDDIWLTDKLNKQIEYLVKNPDIYLLGTAKKVIDKNGEILPSKEKQFYKYLVIKKEIIKGNLFCHSSVVFRKEILNEVGYYNEKFLNTEDYEYWIRILSYKKGEIMPEPLVYYRVHGEMVSLRKRKQQFKYVIRSKINGIFKCHYSLFNLIYIVKDIWPLLIPNFLIKLKKMIIKPA